MGNLQPKLSISSSGGSRLGAGDISLMLIWLHCYRLSFSLCFFLTLLLSCLMLRYDLVRGGRSGAYWSSLYWCLSSTILPLFLCVAIIPTLSTSSLSPSLSPSFLSLSPVCNHNNASLRRPGNKLGPLFFLHTSPLAKTKPIKGWLNYSCCVLPTPGYNSVRLSVGEVWRDAGLGQKNYWGYSLILSLTPPSKPSRHYFIVLTEMKKKVMVA